MKSANLLHKCGLGDSDMSSTVPIRNSNYLMRNMYTYFKLPQKETIMKSPIV